MQQPYLDAHVAAYGTISAVTLNGSERDGAGPLSEESGARRRRFGFPDLGSLSWVVILLLSLKGQRDYGRGWGYAVPLLVGAVIAPWGLRVLSRHEPDEGPSPRWASAVFGAGMGATIGYIESTARAGLPLAQVLLAVAGTTTAGAVIAPWLIHWNYRRRSTGAS